MTWGKRSAIGAMAIVAVGAGILSWDANTWAAGEIGIDPRITWIYGAVIDGTIAVGTASVFELRGGERAAAWAVLLGALAVSLVDNAAHARGGSALHIVGSMVPAALLAGCLFVVELLMRGRSPAAAADARRRARGGRTSRRAPRTRAASAHPKDSARERMRVLIADAARAGRRPTGRELGDATGVSAGHARRLRAEVAGAS